MSGGGRLGQITSGNTLSLSLSFSPSSLADLLKTGPLSLTVLIIYEKDLCCSFCVFAKTFVLQFRLL